MEDDATDEFITYDNGDRSHDSFIAKRCGDRSESNSYSSAIPEPYGDKYCKTLRFLDDVPLHIHTKWNSLVFSRKEELGRDFLFRSQSEQSIKEDLGMEDENGLLKLRLS